MKGMPVEIGNESLQTGNKWAWENRRMKVIKEIDLWFGSGRKQVERETSKGQPEEGTVFYNIDFKIAQKS